MERNRLASILLRPNVSEVSFGYIETLITKALENDEDTPSAIKDTVDDVIDLLRLTLMRTGSGWVAVRGKRISRMIVDCLKSIKVENRDSMHVIASISRLLSAFPIIAMCAHDRLMAEIRRLLMSATYSSQNLLHLISMLIGVKLPSNGVLHEICSITLSRLAICSNSTDAVACLEVLSRVLTFLSSDSQLTNTCLGLCRGIEAQFSDDHEVRKLVFRIRHITSIEPAETEIEIETPPVSVLKRCITLDPEPPAVKEQDTMVDFMDGRGESPRSSCPSLDF